MKPALWITTIGKAAIRVTTARPRATRYRLPTLVAVALFSACSVQAKDFFCSVDTVCSDTLPCYPIEYVWDMQIVQTDEGWVFTYEPDDGSRDVYHQVEGASADTGALFLMLIRTYRSDESVTLFTILPDSRLLISSHGFTKHGAAETAFGSCEVKE